MKVRNFSTQNISIDSTDKWGNYIVGDLLFPRGLLAQVVQTSLDTNISTFALLVTPFRVPNSDIILEKVEQFKILKNSENN